MTRSNKWNVIALGVFLLLLTATLLAYTKHIPVEIKQIPYYDSIGHFLLFGMLSFALYQAISEKHVELVGYSFPMSALIVVCFATVDEFLQLFSNARSFELSDLFFGILGVIIFTSLAVLLKTRRTSQ